MQKMNCAVKIFRTIESRKSLLGSNDDRYTVARFEIQGTQMRKYDAIKGAVPLNLSGANYVNVEQVKIRGI